MVTMMWWEFWLWSLVVGFLFYQLHDLVWTVLVSDPKAAAHFARSNWRSLLRTFIAGVFVFLLIYGWMT